MKINTYTVYFTFWVSIHNVFHCVQSKLKVVDFNFYLKSRAYFSSIKWVYVVTVLLGLLNVELEQVGRDAPLLELG